MSTRRLLPSLPALQAFEAAARLLNFTKAADELGMTQSGVSRHVQGLESFLNLALFERAGSHLALTEIGRSYYEDVVQILARLEEASIDAVRGRRANEWLLVGSTPTLASTWLLPRMRDFCRNHGDIPFELTMLTEDQDVDARAVDIAIMRGAGQWRGRAHKLFDEELVVVASPNLLPPGTPRDMLDFDAIPSLQNASRPSLWLTWLRISGTRHRGTIRGNRFSHSALLIEAAILGLGIAVVPLHYVTSELADRSLHLPFGPPIRSGEAIWLLNPEGKGLKRNMQVLRDWLIDRR
ncbi:LysR substrate-binding domain-containing protein [Falsirhodobacter halotolerans]|uniref:LysR substrate-binding domain-containing protein n=1 Tax=Falsirhodobacter halotolerans TaxID=1146892 RepID=UPI001FD3134C|nr:LysR substrate-binding domain-containing protein [Falsirhodobacter halotolerans]MCJ8140999.1 LysR substrate-binding domain-containing protein [Falsirhodobacter halotolerans]